MQRALEDLIRALRVAGLSISPADSIDAHRAIDVTGFSDRGLAKHALCATLAKSGGEAAVFDIVFDAFFESQAIKTGEAASQGRQQNLDVLPEAEGSALAQIMLSGDEASLSMAMASAANRIGLSGIRFATQRNLLARRLQDEMGMPEVDAIIAKARARSPQTPATARLADVRAAIAAQAQALVDRQFQIYASRTAEELREAQLVRQPLNADEGFSPGDQALMRKAVRRMAKQLADRHSRQRKRAMRGKLDIRRTVRRSLAHEGIPFELIWRTEKVDRPSIVCLCDVSRSVAAAAQFLLTFLYSLNEVVHDLRSFAFAGRLIEVDSLLAQLPVEEAIGQVLREIGFQQTDYGKSLEDFADKHLTCLDRHTTVIVLGDARSNYAGARLDIFAEIAKRSRAVIWLNPEPETYWGSGDSEMRRYERFCHIAQTCNTLAELEHIIEHVLRICLPR